MSIDNLDDMKAFTLPDQDELLRRLELFMDDPHARERFFPIILKDAGRQLVGMGVVMMYTLAVSDYTEGMPPITSTTMMLMARRFVDSIVDDDEVKADAIAMLDRLLPA